MPLVDTIKSFFRTPSPSSRPWSPLFFHPTKRVRLLTAPHIPLEEEFLLPSPAPYSSSSASASADTDTATAKLLLNRYFPITIGALIPPSSQRFQVIGKLGFGRTSTVWLARDFSRREYAALKVLTHTASYPPAHTAGPAGERAVLQRLRQLDTLRAAASAVAAEAPSGRECLRVAAEEFALQDGRGRVKVLVEQPMAESWREKAARLGKEGRRMDMQEVKRGMRAVVRGLVYLHETAGIVHTDISSGNIFISIGDPSTLDAFLSRELADPSPRKPLPDYTVYTSRPIPPSTRTLLHPPAVLLGDFGSACFIERPLVHGAQPRVYRAPEVVLGVPWGVGVDVWSVGLVAWFMVTGKHLFPRPTGAGTGDEAHDAEEHIRDIISVLGMPPAGMWDNRFFTEKGEWKGTLALKPRSKTLRDLVSGVKGEEKEEFLEFVKMALVWDPKERATARKLLDSAWLHGVGDK
ncbi:hypothetical protein TD95_001192 [Thielaviopsis punctulata]|uniref:EKC/KEOPS complex subunit BUD32 n=1 Tax=Thielaviopsis punctulata TaxID=72032 RepID=A0A0F4ZBP7_9PEZI|nr:hypothetical protein TD95_001192 [Thielaviopsis punctulata]